MKFSAFYYAMLLVLMLVVLPLFTKAQSSFSITPTTVEAVKPANVFVFYNYVDFTNHTADTLRMRWVKTILQGHGAPVPPAEWDTAINDPTNVFDPAEGVETANFDLLPDPEITEKFIYQLLPRDTPGAMKVKFTFYALDFPGDSVEVFFNFEATEFIPSKTTETFFEKSIALFPNPASDYFSIENIFAQTLEVQLLTADGKRLETFLMAPQSTRKMACDIYPSGVYYLELTNEAYRGRKVLVIN